MNTLFPINSFFLIFLLFSLILLQFFFTMTIVIIVIFFKTMQKLVCVCWHGRTMQHDWNLARTNDRSNREIMIEFVRQKKLPWTWRMWNKNVALIHTYVCTIPIIMSDNSVALWVLALWIWCQTSSAQRQQKKNLKMHEKGHWTTLHCSEVTLPISLSVFSFRTFQCWMALHVKQLAASYCSLMYRQCIIFSPFSIMT